MIIGTLLLNYKDNQNSTIIKFTVLGTLAHQHICLLLVFLVYTFAVFSTPLI